MSHDRHIRGDEIRRYGNARSLAGRGVAIARHTKMPQLSNLKYSCSYRNAQIYWGFSAHPSMEKSGRRIWVEEGEELGSNLLHVDHRGGKQPSVLPKTALPGSSPMASQVGKGRAS